MPFDFETALRGLYEVQRVNSENLGQLIKTVDSFVDSTNAALARSQEADHRLEQSHLRLEESHVRMEEAVTRYTESAEARMKQMEQNLDALIRIITAEHKNGKGQH